MTFCFMRHARESRLQPYESIRLYVLSWRCRGATARRQFAEVTGRHCEALASRRWLAVLVGTSGQLRPTPAMMAAVTNQIWTFQLQFEEGEPPVLRSSRTAEILSSSVYASPR